MKYLKLYCYVVCGFAGWIGIRSLIRQENLYPRALENIESNILWSLAIFAFLVTRERQKP